MKLFIIPLFVFFLLATPASSNASDRWVDTGSWFGRGQMTTRIFQTASPRWRLYYLNHGPGSLRIRVFNTDHEQVSEIYTQRNVPGIRTVRTPPGYYYILAEPQQSRWEMVVRQQISRTEEWLMRQEVQEYHGRQQRVASFSGGSGEAEYSFSIPPGKSWRMVYTNTTSGKLQLRVFGGRDMSYTFHKTTDRPVRTDTWIHQSGDFTLQTSAQDTNWRVDFYAVLEEEE